MNAIHVQRIINWLAGSAVLLLCFGSSSEQAPAGRDQSVSAPDVTPAAVLAMMENVAKWQLAHPSSHPQIDWTQGAGDAGLMALGGISGDSRFLDSLGQMAERNHWQLGPRPYMADDQCIGQTYAELYLRYRENRMIAPLRQRFDSVLAHPANVSDLDMNQPDQRALNLWSWCDALFMGPPAWARLSAVTGDRRYLDFAVRNWWRTTDFLYDRTEHLYFRDSRYFKRREANGQKMFWSRGNGWVMAGLTRLLQYLPSDHPERVRFERLFREMAVRILGLQQPDSLWHSSLLDPLGYSEKETSGSAFFVYALAWGINQGLLDHAKFEVPVRKAWSALANCADADGRLTHVQPTGEAPQKFDVNSTEVYGTGAFLLAGSEIYRMALMENATQLTVTVTNPSKIRRDCETIELDLVKIASRLHLDLRTAKFVITSGVSSCILESQTYSSAQGQEPDRILFQVDLASRETRSYYILDGSALPAVPPPLVKTFARYAPERYDDFAWESDRIAFRMYGQALETAPGENMTSSGVDVWIKSQRKLIVNLLYASGHYHDDNGTAMDDYRVGRSRGDGGLGVWDGERLYVSDNYRHWRVITNGPIRSVFELTYDPWEAGNGRTVSEVKRISIDAGSWMSHAESLFRSNHEGALTIGVGLAERPCGPDGREIVHQDKKEGWMTYWQPEDRPKGRIGVAILLPENSVMTFADDAPGLADSVIHEVVPQPTVEGAPAIRNLLALTRVTPGRTFSYYFGACWDRSGDFIDDIQWERYIREFAERRNTPVKVSFGVPTHAE